MKREGQVVRRAYILLPKDARDFQVANHILPEVFRRMNHLADIYIITEDPVRDWETLSQTMEMVAEHLHSFGFVRVQLRPVHPVDPSTAPGLRNAYLAMSAMARPFYEEALSHQVASRWTLMPILRAGSSRDLDAATDLASFLRQRMILPSYSLKRGLPGASWSGRIDTSKERIILEEDGRILESLFRNDLLDDLILWALSSEGGFSLEPCAGIILDFETRRSRRCPKSPWEHIWEWERVLSYPHDLEQCLVCWDGIPDSTVDEMTFNGRKSEAGRVSLQLGVFAMTRGDFQVAEAHLLRASHLLPEGADKGEDLLYLGMLRLARGEIEEAHQILSKARCLLGDSPSVMYHLGRCEFLWKDYIAASELFRDALEKGLQKEARDDLLIQLAICHLNLEEYEDAREVLGKIEEETPVVLFYRAMALLGLGHTQRALELFLRALERGPDREDLSSILFYIGYCHKELGNFAQACEWLERATDADPQNYEAWNLLGYCRFRLGLHHESIGAFLKALEIKPRSALDMANIASNLRDLGDRENSIKWYRRALTLDPTLGFALENLKKLEAQDGAT